MKEIKAPSPQFRKELTAFAVPKTKMILTTAHGSNQGEGVGVGRKIEDMKYIPPKQEPFPRLSTVRWNKMIKIAPRMQCSYVFIKNMNLNFPRTCKNVA